jgi:hypothetical protein
MINPMPEIELDELRIRLRREREKSWRVAALFAIVAMGLCLLGSSASAAPQNSETAFTPAQLEELLDKASALCDKYRTLFRDLTAEEKRVFELYDKKTGKIGTQRQTVSDATTPSRGRSKPSKLITISPPASRASGCRSAFSFRFSIR